MKIKARIILPIVLALIFVSIFSGCTVVPNKNMDVEIEGISESIYFEVDKESEIFYNQGENLVEMKITQAKEFKDGYAYLLLEGPGRNKYNAITDKNGNITFFQEEYERGSFTNSNNGYFYFYRHDTEALSCINYNGEEIYKIEQIETDNISNYFFLCGELMGLFCFAEK